MRAQFLQQIVHTFDKVLSSEKWNGIIVCDGIIVCAVHFREGEGGKRRNVHYCTSTIKNKFLNECEGAGLKDVNT